MYGVTDVPLSVPVPFLYRGNGNGRSCRKAFGSSAESVGDFQSSGVVPSTASVPTGESGSVKGIRVRVAAKMAVKCVSHCPQPLRVP